MTSFNSRKSWCLAAVLTAMVWAISASSAWAHHPMDGKTPTTLMQGLLSGFGHPVIGPDHFAFIIALGTAAALLRSGMAVIGAFITASTAGVMIHLDRFGTPTHSGYPSVRAQFPTPTAAEPLEPRACD